MMDCMDFSEEEIREQLALLGYRNIPKHRLQEFKRGQTFLLIFVLLLKMFAFL